MTREFPTGLCINAEENIDDKTLRVEFPTKNGHIDFKRLDKGNFSIQIFDKTANKKQTIGKAVSIKLSKKILSHILMPHKDKKFGIIVREVKKLIPKKRRKFNLPLNLKTL